MRPSRLLLTVLLLSAVFPQTQAPAEEYIEDFATTAFKDPLNTTAWWDTSAAELKLFPFEATLAGGYNTPGDAFGVAVTGNYAFVADGDAGLQIIHIHYPANPTLAGNYNTPGSAQDVAVSGNQAYVADGASGLQVIDITDPRNPALAGSYDTPGSANGVFVYGDYAYVGDGSGGLQVIDISDPTNPILAGNYDTPGFPRGVFVSGDHAYVTDWNDGLQVIDISDPTNPTLAGSYDTPGTAVSVYVSGDYAYLADRASGLLVMDISDPTNPTLAGSLATGGDAFGVFVSGDQAYLADMTMGLLVIDISDPMNPILAGGYNASGSDRAVVVAGEFAYVAAWFSGLQVIDVSNPTILNSVGTYDTPGQSYGLHVSGDYVYLADWYSGLQIFDVSDPTNPTLAGNIDELGAVYGVFVSGDHAYLTALDSGLHVVDISDPTNPTLVGGYDTPGTARRVTLHGDYAYVADSGPGLQVLDISDPTNPILVSTYDTGQSAHAVSISGDHAYVADGGSGLLVLDIIDPTAPSFVGSYDFPPPGETLEVFVSGDYAYLVDGASGFWVMRVDDPTNPYPVGLIDTPGTAKAVFVSGDHAFVADGDSGLHRIDISDPTNPALSDSYDTLGHSRSVFVAGEFAYIGDGGSGLQVIGVFAGWPFDMEFNIGQSLVVNSLDFGIVRCRITSTQTEQVTWEVSADDGSAWADIPADGSWSRVSNVGNQLIWRSTHTYKHGGVNPSCSELQLTTLYEHGPIDDIVDVPEDQGGWLRLHFTRSGYDFAVEDIYPVTGYQVYRRVDDPMFRTRVRHEGEIPCETELTGTRLGAFESKWLRILDGRSFVLGGADKRGEFPPGIWEFLTWVGATQSDTYMGTVPSVEDSSATGISWSVYLVTTHTTTPSVWFASPPDSGYSVDNIAPGVPQNLVFGEPGILDWDRATEEDFSYHSVYGSESEIFDETATLIGYTVDPTFDVSADPYDYYHVTTTDDADNEGDAATIENPTTSTPDGVRFPTEFVLRAARPNPFQVETSIEFDLPDARDVRLSIFDASGRQVRVVIDDHQPAGRHQVAWDGTSDAGQRVAPGIYFARIAAGSFEASRRLVLMR